MFFWQTCDVRLSWIRQAILIAVQVFLLFFTFFSICKLYKLQNGFKFECIPLFCNIISLGSLITITLFCKDFQFYLASCLIQLYTYYLFLHTFMCLCLNEQSGDNESRKNKTRVLLSIFWILTVTTIILIVLIFCSLLSTTCQIMFGNFYYGLSGANILIYLLTLWYGIKITRSINKRNELILPLFDELDNNEDQYIRIRKRQILLIIVTFTLSIIIRAVWTVLFKRYDQSYKCLVCEEVNILIGTNILGQILISVKKAVSLVPNILLPIALCFLTVGDIVSKSQIVFPTFFQTHSESDNNITKTQIENIRNSS